MGLPRHWGLLPLEDVGQSPDLLSLLAGKGPEGDLQT